MDETAGKILAEDNLMIDDNHIVSMHYRLSNGFGELIDSSQGEVPLVYMHNTGVLLPSLERELTGKHKGDALDVTIYPEDGYGYADEALVQELPLEAFSDIAELKPGMRIKVLSKDEQSQLITVTEIREDSVVADANHPLAGQVLHFSIAIIAVREPTESELEQGFATAP